MFRCLRRIIDEYLGGMGLGFKREKRGFRIFRERKEEWFEN